MTEAQTWSVWGWLMEKRRLRRTADVAWEALGECEAQVKDGWGDDLKKAWRELEALSALDGHVKTKRAYEKAKDEAKDVDPQIKQALERWKEADAEAYKARMAAEETFDVAERRLSTSMACDGARQAIDAWDLREKLIRKAEALGRKK